ncbi:MAG: helix-hairpin-helix domain-containing protein [Oscillospiraceae bacterium]|jgi:competence ComEA-like helix-hairpin-helix protein|nr:helix-hairpin-helix domain-containing protein [Oscillospiraceae bacterium]
MDSQKKQIRFLVAVALILCAGVVFYNIFFIPEVDAPNIVYIDSEMEKNNELASISKNETPNDGKININSCSAEELSKSLPGVGMSIAERIVKKREENGPFLNIDDIKNVNGIGKKKFEKIKDFICV